LTAISEMIAELIRAADEVQRFSNDYKRSLLLRAYSAILNGREEVGFHPSKSRSDTAIDLFAGSEMINQLTDDYIRGLLLDAAHMLRIIKIVLDARDASLTEGGHNERRSRFSVGTSAGCKQG
jgi:hypothetical protein